MDISDNCSLYPLTSIINKKEVLLSYVNYTRGICELDRDVSIIIDLADFLGTAPVLNKEELIILRVSVKKGDFALIIPAPKITTSDIQFEEGTDKIKYSDINIPLISSNYVIINNEVYLRIDVEQLSNYIADEISNYLTMEWKNSIQSLSFESNENLAKVIEKSFTSRKMMNYTSNTVKSNSIKSNNYLVCKVDTSYFSVKEDDIIQVISTKTKVTNIPDGPSWIQGVMDYQNKDIIVVNLSKLLQLHREDNVKPITVLISASIGPIAFQCNSVYHLSEQDMLSIKEYDLTSSSLPYTNVYDVNGRMIFHLNVEYLQYSISEKRDILSQDEWPNLLSVSVKDYQKNQSKDEKDQIYRNNSLLVRIGNDNYNVPIDDIITIASTNDQERVTLNELSLLAYCNSWIPSVRIGDPSGSEIEHKISLILKCDDFVFELQVDELRLVELGQQLIDASTWNTILGGSSPIGLKTPSHTNAGLSFGLDLNDLLLNSYSSVIRDDINFTDFINGLSLDPPSLIEESTVISKQIANIWEDDIELYLIIVDSNENTKSALNTDLIASIALESDPNIELFPWENNKSESHFYVTTTAIDDHQKALQIPANCYLLGVGRESINSDDRFTYVTLEDEKIPILKIKNNI